MGQIRGVGHDLVDLRFHEVGVTRLVHVAYVVEVEQRQVKGLRPRFKFRLCQCLEERIVGLRELFEGLHLEQAESTQLVFEHRVVRIRGIRSGRRTTFRLPVRIAGRGTFQEDLRKRLAHLGFGGLVVLAIADAEVLFARVGFVTLGLGVVAKFLFLLVRRHRKFVLEHVLRKLAEAAPVKRQVVGRLHERALRRTSVTEVQRDVEPETVVQELVQADRHVARYIQLRCRLREFRFRGAARSGERRKVTVLVADRTGNGEEVREIHLCRRTRRIAPFRIHVGKSQVVNPERTRIKVGGRRVRIRDNHEAHPVDIRDRRITHELDLFFAVTAEVLFHRFHKRRAPALLQVGEVRDVHGKRVRKPVFFVAVLFTFALGFRALVVHRTVAPFVVVAGAVQRAGTELQREPDGYRGGARPVVDFHLERLVRRQVLLVGLEHAGHPHFLAGLQVLVIEHQCSFLQGSVRLGIAFRLGIGRLEIRVRIFAAVDGRDLHVRRVRRGDVLRHRRLYAVHAHDLRVLGRARLVEVGNRRFFPGVTQHGKAHDLHLRLGDTRIQLAYPETGIQGLRQDGLVIATARRDNRIVLVQRDAPLAPSVLEHLEIRRVRVREIDAVTHEVDVRIKRAVLVDVFGIVCAFAGVVFRTVNSDRRVAVVVQVFVEVIQRDIGRRARLHSRVYARNTFARTAIPHGDLFFGTGSVVEALVMERRRGAQVVFAIVNAVRFVTIDRKVFTHLAQVEEQRAHVTTGHDLDVLHLAHVLVVRTVRAHHATPGITRQVVVRTQGHLEHGQVLVVHVGVADIVVDILVEFGIVAMPDEFALVAEIQSRNIGRGIVLHAARRRRMVPGKPRQRIREAVRRRLEIFDKRFGIVARIRVVAAARKFRLEPPAGLGFGLDARNLVHEVGQRLYRILQAQVHAPQEAGEGFVAERRSLGRRALALVECSNAEHGTGTESVTFQREFRSRAQQQLVVYLEKRFTFERHLDFLVRVKGALAQEFNLAKFVVHLVVGTAGKHGRTRRQLFGTRRDIHTGASAHGIARVRVAHADGGTAALAHRFKVELARVAVQVIDRQRIELRDGIRRIKVA